MLDLTPLDHQEFTDQQWEEIARKEYHMRGKHCWALNTYINRSCVRLQWHAGPHVCCSSKMADLLIW
jgi:hypothetical protein